jgi:hypothetical protein
VNDNGIRVAAVIAAAALLAAPYRAQIQAAASRAVEAGKEKAGLLMRLAAAGLLIAAAWGKVPMPTLAVPSVAPVVAVDTPSDEMQRVVTPIADVMRNASAVDRALWAQLWSKAAIVVAGDAVSTEVVFTDTRSLRAFTVLALDLGWRRLGANQPGKYAGLREATEVAFAQVIGPNEVPVTKELRARYAELCRAIAWAGVGKG